MNLRVASLGDRSTLLCGFLKSVYGRSSNRDFANKMSHNKRCYVKKINKSAAQGSRRVDLMFKQASLKAFTSDFDVCDKDLGIDSVSSATSIESNESVHQPNLSATVSTSACETNPESESNK